MSGKEPELPVVGYWIEFSDGQKEAIKASFVEDVGKDSDLIKDELVKREQLLRVLAQEYKSHVDIANAVHDCDDLPDEECHHEQGALKALTELTQRLFGWGEDEAVRKLRAAMLGETVAEAFE